jgi:uncharacterized repeat protein (TIGR03803 family)
MFEIHNSIRRCMVGSAVALVLSAALADANAHHVTVLYAFKGGSDGAYPGGQLVRDRSDNFFGTTYQGGGTACSGSGCGTVYEVSPNGADVVVYSFKGGNDGAYPLTGVVRDSRANLYGTTYQGGGTGCGGLGCGVAFKIAPDGTETILHSFQGGSDGAFPRAGLLLDRSGNLYGTTYGGGTESRLCGPDGCGTAFKISSKGTETLVYTFCSQQNCLDGSNPRGALIMDSAGHLYGTTGAGGSGGSGTIFELGTSGQESVLYSFCIKAECVDGEGPAAKLTMDSAGSLLGTTVEGGDWGEGTVFRLASDGTETVLLSFNPSSDGINPESGVVIDKSGNIYGAPGEPGNRCKKFGLVLKLTPAGEERIFCTPEAVSGDMIENNGELYAPAFPNAKRDMGMVFRLKD